MSFRFQLRRGTTAQWAAANPVLAAGEPGVDLDTGVLKIGDGVTPWADLTVAGGGGGVTDHGALTGLGDDDHTQYHTDARGDARYYTRSQVDALVSGATPSSASGALPRALSLAAAEMADADTTPFKILFVGDSLTWSGSAWTDRFVKRLAIAGGITPIPTVLKSKVAGDVSVPASGIYGVNCAADAASSGSYMTNGNAPAMATALQPSLIIHGVGTNDFMGSQSPTGTYTTNVTAAIAALDAVCTVPPVHLLWWLGSLYQDKPYQADAYITALLAIAAANPARVCVVDLGPYADTLGVNAADPYALDTGDGLHLTAAGYRAIGELLARVILAAPPVGILGYSAAAPGDVTAPTVGTLSVTAETSTSIDVTVTGASDAGGLHATPYAFSTNNGSTWGAWQASASATLSGLAASTSYTLRHKVRDAAGNETTGTAVTHSTDAAGGGDVTSPTVGTRTASAITSSGFTLTVSGAADETALHATPYAFTTDGGTTWSAYQASAVYVASGLASSTGYSTNHRVRDAAGNVSTGTAATVTTSAAAGSITDSFNRANSTTGLGVTDTGQTWTHLGAGVAGISGNAAYRVSGTAVAVVDFGAVDMDVSAKLTVAGDFFRLYARAVDVDNYYFAESGSNGTTVKLMRRVAGADASVGGGSFAVAVGDTITLRAKTNGANVDLSLLINGVNKVTISQTGAQVLTGTKAGVGGLGQSTARLDDFTVTAA